MENKEREALINKIRGMMEIQSEDSNAFEGEMANAAALAQKLMDKYGITLAEVEMSGNKDVEVKFQGKDSLTSVGGIEKWHWQLAQAIGRITQTKYYSSSRYAKAKRASVNHPGRRIKYSHDGKTKDYQEYKIIVFWGTPSAVEIATMLFDQWVPTIRKMALEATRIYIEELEAYVLEEYGKKVDFKRKGGKEYRQYGIELEDTPRAFLAGWLMGCTRTINKKLEEQEKARTAATANAIVLVQTKLETAFVEFSSKNLGKGSSRGGGAINILGLARGTQAGEKISIGSKELKG